MVHDLAEALHVAPSLLYLIILGGMLAVVLVAGMIVRRILRRLGAGDLHEPHGRRVRAPVG